MKTILLNLQALRAIAALNVVALHAVTILPSYHKEAAILSFFDGWGSSGVDIFFVISGFVMTYILFKKDMTPSSFLFDRISRIAPLYYLLTLLLVILIILFPQLFRSISAENLDSRFFASILFVSQIFLQSGPLLYDGWTLEFEMLFYLVLTLGLFFRKNIYAISFSTISIIFLMLTVNLNSISVEFIFGIVAAVIYIGLSPSKFIYFLFLIVGVVGLVSSIFITPQAGSMWELRILRYGIPAFFIVLGAAGLPSIRRGLLTNLGDASYSIYLIQVFTIPFFYKTLSYFSSAIFWNNLYVDIVAAFCIAITAIAGIIVHRYFEAPLTQLFRNHYAKPWR